MDDLNSTINSILGDPQKMEQLRAVAQSLGLNPPDTPPAESQNGTSQGGAPQSGMGGGFDPSILSSILQNFQGAGGQNNGQQNQQTQQAQQSGQSGQPGQFQQGGADGGMFGNFATALPKIMGIMSTFNQSDKNVELLHALKPHFSPARAGRIDDAVRIMQLMRAWPSLRDSGLLGNLGNLFSGGGSK